MFRKDIGWRRGNADDDGDSSASGFCMQDMSIARDLTTCERLNVRVAGEAMIRGGVERIRWRARDSKGTTVLGSARDVSVIL